MTELRSPLAGGSASQVNKVSSMAVPMTMHTDQEGGPWKLQDVPSGVRWVILWRYLVATVYRVFCLLKKKCRIVTLAFKCLVFSALPDILPNLPRDCRKIYPVWHSHSGRGKRNRSPLFAFV